MYPATTKGGALISAIIAMVVVSLLIPGLLLLLHRSNRLATAQPDNDEGITARAELAELFGSVDPIGKCASPVSGASAAYRDQCFREHRVAGASLIEAPALPAANPAAGYGACWLTTREDDPTQQRESRQRRCIVLEGDSGRAGVLHRRLGPCLRVLSQSNEADGEPVLVDRHGGGLLLIRSWDETDSDNDPATVPFLPHEWTDPPTDRLIYSDVEWWCLRWRTPDGFGGVTDWDGDCPAPADPCERSPDDPTTSERERWDSAWSAQTATWTASTSCPQRTTALPDPAQAGPANSLTGTLIGPHPSGDRTPLGDRITDVELLVCVASDHADRLRGASHCTVDRMRFNIADPHGPMPPAPALRLTDPRVAADGLTVEEGASATSIGEVGHPTDSRCDRHNQRPDGSHSHACDSDIHGRQLERTAGRDGGSPRRRHHGRRTAAHGHPHRNIHRQRLRRHATGGGGDRPGQRPAGLGGDPAAVAMAETDTATIAVSLAAQPQQPVIVAVDLQRHVSGDRLPVVADLHLRRLEHSPAGHRHRSRRRRHQRRIRHRGAVREFRRRQLPRLSASVPVTVTDDDTP